MSELRIRAVCEERGELPIGIRWIIEGKEDVMSPHFDDIVRLNSDLLGADGCLWEGAPAYASDGRPSLTLGQRRTRCSPRRGPTEPPPSH
jgi:hypothetical protein